MELVFKALADSTRRALLDALMQDDGQTLGSLAERCPMTRPGVAKHLRILEEAGLVVARRSGREKRHYLNVVPIREIHDRWITRYTESWAAGVSQLKRDLEHGMEKVFEIYVATTPERLWQAITDPEIRARYHFGAAVHSDWSTGSTFTLDHPGAAGPLAEGENLVVDPPHRLVQSMRTLWSPDAAQQGTTRVTWEIEQVGDSCRLTITHDQLAGDAPPELYGGWPMILSGLKTWLETGRVLTTPGSLRYREPAPTEGSVTTEDLS
ncbi:metalloregulator ArsR/SmtB family transcription factor [Cellulomonas sp. NTE-D12]|uniref:ArsR/SmtB family transcription factor n=1 Tax=Cellulomonas sp. NTE-D12 TaxID=2962632 RepID=UPI003081F8BD|nr:putative transcriptional regulator, ArsR family protein [Cellulomonas sp. NTE-D12]